MSEEISELQFQHLARILDWAMCPSYEPDIEGGVGYTEPIRPICRACGILIEREGNANCPLRISVMNEKAEQKRLEELTGKGEWVES